MDPPTLTAFPTPTSAASTASASVQHVTKRSSDELLRKFADFCNEAEASAKKKASRVLSKQRKRSRKSGEFDGSESLSDVKSSSLVERRSLLPVVGGTKNKGLLIRQLGVHGRSRHIRNKSLFGTIHMTWRRTIEGASKVFIEKHYNRHRHLINDIQEHFFLLLLKYQNFYLAKLSWCKFTFIFVFLILYFCILFFYTSNKIELNSSSLKTSSFCLPFAISTIFMMQSYDLSKPQFKFSGLVAWSNIE